MDVSQLPSDEIREMLRDSLRGFLAEHWNAADAATPVALPETISSIWTRLVGQGVASLGCDFSEGGLREILVVMAEDARIGDTHVSRVGLVAGDGGTVIWPLLVGINKAKEFLIRGTLLKGKEAERIGLVNHVVPRSEVLAKAREIALELANGPTWAIRWTKLSINQIVKDRVNMLLEASMALEQVTFETADHKEATTSFKEKRKPKFGQG